MKTRPEPIWVPASFSFLSWWPSPCLYLGSKRSRPSVRSPRTASVDCLSRHPLRLMGSTEDSQSLWARTASGDDAARDAVLSENLNLVHHVARQLSRSLAVEADFDELVSAGTIGLMTAVKAFDPRRGLAFSTFAVPRIRGSILDELRRQDRVPRSVRRKTRAIAAMRESLAGELGRSPLRSEVSRALEIPESTLLRWELDVERSIEISLDRPPKGTRRQSDGPEHFDEGLRDQGLHDLEERLTREQQVTMLA